MRKFIIKSLFFVVPFFSLYAFNTACYDTNQGDLARMGYILCNPTPCSSIKNKYNNTKQYTLVSELNLDTTYKYKVLSVGDSFSDEARTYKNYLANLGLSVVHLDEDPTKNPLQQLIKLINGDFFDFVNVNYVILESVERGFIKRCNDINLNLSVFKDSLKDFVKKKKLEEIKRNNFFAGTTIKIPLINILYNFEHKPLISSTYCFFSNNINLFSNHPNKILIYNDDIKYLSDKNNKDLVKKSNEVINYIAQRLQKKGIHLILVIAPDKYDLYYPYMADKEGFEKPMFYDYYAPLKKDYYYINTLEILRKKLKTNKDVYYYDDTHWSPIGSDAVAKEIAKIIKP